MAFDGFDGVAPGKKVLGEVGEELTEVLVVVLFPEAQEVADN